MINFDEFETLIPGKPEDSISDPWSIYCEMCDTFLMALVLTKNKVNVNLECSNCGAVAVFKDLWVEPIR